ncbi:XRE family transcriptional regulator [Paenibacillus mucilaginosus]|nr:helix-turn-helix transcriptional regulator [Paenibacillus mucilaginosus]WFA20675.1 XRE family transcriptional regulator [Paenibacillus mucilaginosus]
MEIFERIREVRKSKGVSQTFVAKKVGMTIANYNMKENGKRAITVQELESIAQALDEPVSNFFDENLNVKLNLSSV